MEQKTHPQKNPPLKPLQANHQSVYNLTKRSCNITWTTERQPPTSSYQVALDLTFLQKHL